MVSHLYPRGMWKFLCGGLDWSEGTWRLLACSAAYVYSPCDGFVSDLGEAIVARSEPLTGMWSDRQEGSGMLRFGADNAVFRRPTPGASIAKLVLCCDTGDDAASRLLGCWDIARCDVTDQGDIAVAFPGGVLLSFADVSNEELAP